MTVYIFVFTGHLDTFFWKCLFKSLGHFCFLLECLFFLTDLGFLLYSGLINILEHFLCCKYLLLLCVMAFYLVKSCPLISS